MRVGASFGILVAFVGCTSKNPLYCESNADCADDERPFCDVDGMVGHDKANECIAISCAPSTFFECRGTEALACDADGTSYDVAVCELGCNTVAGACNECTPGEHRCENGVARACGDDGRWTDTPCALACVEGPDAHCAYLEPKYLPDTCDATTTLGDLNIVSSGSFDTSLDANCTGGIVPQTAAADLCVARYRSISIAADARLSLVGTRTLVMVTDDDITIDGHLDASAKGSTAGPGGSFSNSGGSVATTPTPIGGGGAGFQTNGAAGGSSLANGGSMNGGAATVNPATQSALVGGRRSGDTPSGLKGGAGGGGVSLISCRGAISVTGWLLANGGGGPGGAPILVVYTPGFGGGSGGNVVLQGLSVSVTGHVFANGGGGGAGATTTGPGLAGADGIASTDPAPGGFSRNAAGAGGKGGARGIAPTVGARPSDSSLGYPGGGGGSVGFFQTYTPAGVTPTLTPVGASPAFQPNGTISTR